MSRPVAARASRTAAIVASVPLLTQRTRSSEGMRRLTSSASSTSASHGAPYVQPRPAPSRTAPRAAGAGRPPTSGRPRPPPRPPPRPAPGRARRDARAPGSAGPRSRRSRCSSCRRRRTASRLRRARRKKASRRLPGTPARVSSRRRATPDSPGRIARSSASRQRGRLEIVVLAGGDARADEVSGLRPPATLEIGDSIDVIGLPLDPPGLDAVFLLETIHQHVHFAPHEPLQALGRDAALQLDDFREAVLLDGVVHVVLVLRRPRPLLR